ncbi:hypothetical protein U1Q18_030945 [Sarracenia purpurea var. burkii]
MVRMSKALARSCNPLLLPGYWIFPKSKRFFFPGSPPAPDQALARFRLRSYPGLLLEAEGQYGFSFGPRGFSLLRWR